MYIYIYTHIHTLYIYIYIHIIYPHGLRVLGSRSKRFAEPRGLSIHASFVLLQTLTPNVQRKQRICRDGSCTFTEVARLALLEVSFHVNIEE